MKEYVFLRINERFKNLFLEDNLNSFLELYFRRDENVFYKQQFNLFLEKNKLKEITYYLKDKLNDRKELDININKLSLKNEYNETQEILELRDNYIILKSLNIPSVFSKYLCEYNSDFIYIDINNNKIQRLALVN